MRGWQDADESEGVDVTLDPFKFSDVSCEILLFLGFPSDDSVVMKIRKLGLLAKIREQWPW